MRIVVNKHWQVYIGFGRTGSLSYTVILNLPQIIAYARSSESHALPVYKENSTITMHL